MREFPPFMYAVGEEQEEFIERFMLLDEFSCRH